MGQISCLKVRSSSLCFDAMVVEAQALRDRGVSDSNPYTPQSNMVDLQEGTLYMEGFFFFIYLFIFVCFFAWFETCKFHL